MAAAAILGCIVCYSTSKKCLQILLISRRRGESRGRLQRSLFRTTQRRIAGGLEMQALSFKQSFFPSFSALLPDVSFFMKCYITFSFTSPSWKKEKVMNWKSLWNPKKSHQAVPLYHYLVELQCNGSKKSVHGFVQMMSILKVQSLEVNHKLNDVILLPAQFVLLSKMILQRKKRFTTYCHWWWGRSWCCFSLCSRLRRSKLDAGAGRLCPAQTQMSGL